VRQYKTGDVPYRDVTRQTLLGENPGEEPFNFVTRYFEIQPGGYSTSSGTSIRTRWWWFAVAGA